MCPFIIYRYESRLSNSTVLEVCCRQNPNSTDVYLHFENPKTNEILAYDDPVLARYVTSESSANNIKYSVSGGLSVQASDIHPPYEVTFNCHLQIFLKPKEYSKKSSNWFNHLSLLFRKFLRKWLYKT